jgi:sporulation protein YlmC with PRC-barrel domain
MLKKHMAACLVVTAFAAAPAFAQTSPSAPTDRPTATGSGSTAAGSPAMQPGASANPSMGSSSMGSSAANSSTMSQSGAMQGQFVTSMQQGQMMASDLIGTRVVSANNESIGDINDVIVDRNGQVMAAVVGVGGFLGIGEKDVAVPFNALEFASAQQASAMDSNNGNRNVTSTGSTATGNPAGQGSNGSSSNMAASNTNTSASDNQPERVVLRMTKAELQAAPAFRQNGDSAANRSNTGTSGTTTTPAPKQ